MNYVIDDEQIATILTALDDASKIMQGYIPLSFDTAENAIKEVLKNKLVHYNK